MTSERLDIFCSSPMTMMFSRQPFWLLLLLTSHLTPDTSPKLSNMLGLRFMLSRLRSSMVCSTSLLDPQVAIDLTLLGPRESESFGFVGYHHQVLQRFVVQFLGDTPAFGLLGLDEFGDVSLPRLFALDEVSFLAFTPPSFSRDDGDEQDGQEE